jgi:dTDP-glucose 4,6-dehydratase
LIAIPYSYQNPNDVVQTNVLGTAHVLDACRTSRALERVVLTSTSEVYGTAQYVPIDERHPLIGQSPYSASKIAAEQLVVSFVRSYELPAVIVRPFNTFGPRQSMRAVIPTIITQALWDDRIRLGAVHTSRDFTFAPDTARGLIQAGQAPDIEGEVFNLGHGKDISVGDLADLIRNMVGRDVPVEQEESRLRPPDSEVGRLCSDPARARESIGWNPTHSLPEGLAVTIDWIRSRGVGERIKEFVL